MIFTFSNKENFKNIWHHTAGGLFSGNIENLKLYSRLFKEKVAQIYEEEWYQMDEAIMTMVQRENPNLFEFFYGDYDGIIANYAGAKHSLHIIFAGLQKCLRLNNTGFAYKILRLSLIVNLADFGFDESISIWDWNSSKVLQAS